MDKKLKIAICLRGLMRTGASNKKVFEHFFEREYDVDYFVHTWDLEREVIPPIGAYYSETPLSLNLRTQRPYNLLKSKIDKFKQLYKPKIFVKEDLKSYWATKNLHTIPENDWMFPMGYHPQFISAYYSNRLRVVYENSKNVKYDVVISTRPDIIFESDQKTIDYLNSEIAFFAKDNKHFGILNLDPKFNEESPNVDDIFYMASPSAMDKFMEFYNPRVNKESHLYILKNLKEKELIPKPLSWSYAINRSWCGYLDPVEDFKTIFVEEMLMMADNFVYEDMYEPLRKIADKLGYVSPNPKSNNLL